MKKISKPHPEGLDEVNRIKPTGEIREFVNHLYSDIESEDGARQRWKEQIEHLDKLRFGIRRKRTHPWPHCANYSIPLIDNDIRKLKPSYVNLQFGVSPVCTFVPYGPEDVEPMRKRELLHDWRLRTQVELFKPYCIGVDQILGSRGQTVFRTIWKYSTRTFGLFIDINDLSEQVVEAIYDPRVTDEILKQILVEQYRIDTSFDENIEALDKAVARFRDGETEIDIDLVEEAENRPEVTACDVKDDLVIPIDTKDINDARFIDYKFWLTKNDIKIAINNKKYEKYDDSEINGWIDKNADYIEESNDGLILLHEVCCWYDINNDGISERCIITYPDENPQSVLRFIELPYDHGQWPYAQVKREILEDEFYSSRGLPTLKEDFQEGVSTAVNQAIDYGTLINMPERVARKGILSNPRNRRFIPGELTEVNGDISQYEMRQIPNITQPILFQQAQYLKSWSDQTGQQSSGLSSQTDLPGAGERGRKTKAEIETLTAMMSEDKSLDLIVFQQQMAKLHYQIDALYYQFGSEEEEVQITGRPKMSISRDEIQGKFNIVPNGRLDNSNPIMRLNKAVMAFNYGMQNPYIKQRELVDWVFKEIDQNRAATLVYTEEEIIQLQQMQAQQQAQAQGQALQTQLGVQKAADDLEIRKDVTKEALLTPITGRKHAPD